MQQSLQRHAVVHDPERKKQVITDSNFAPEICISHDVMLRSHLQVTGDRFCCSTSQHRAVAQAFLK